MRRRLLLCAVAVAAAGALGASRPPDDAPAAAPAVRTLELESRVFGNTRLLRVLLPKGYDLEVNRERRYPVFYFLDGTAAFDLWNVPAVARRLAADGAIPETIFVGIDNGGVTSTTTNPVRDRAGEYIPWPDPTWTGEDAPEPRGTRFPGFLIDEVMPRVNGAFRTLTGPEHTGLAGASYGGAAALYTVLTHPGLVDFLLLESPSMQVGDGKLFELAGKEGARPARVCLGVGTEEGDTPGIQEQILGWARRLGDILESRWDGSRTKFVIQEGGIHWYSSWGERLPAALTFLLGPEAPVPDPPADPEPAVPANQGR